MVTGMVAHTYGYVHFFLFFKFRPVLSVSHPFVICYHTPISDQSDDSDPKLIAETNDVTVQMTKNDQNKIKKCKAKSKNATNE